MILEGKTNNAVIFTDDVESACLDQLRHMMNYPGFSNPIRIMPDCYVGNSSVVGFTMPVGDGVVPNVVGTDIGCGVLACNIGKETINLQRLDTYIRNNIPSGFHRHARQRMPQDEIADYALHCIHAPIDRQIAEESLGTLGGGNHFISIERSETTGDQYLIVHSGSCHTGVEVASYWQQKAAETASCNDDGVPKELCAVYGRNKDLYWDDMIYCQQYAHLNRVYMIRAIAYHLFCDRNGPDEYIESVHNCIGADHIIRNGAISAAQDERCIIPLNMRDGSLLCIGKGNPEWNYSAPYGAGRRISSSQTAETISMEEYTTSMDGVFTTCIGSSTLNESPVAYKSGIEALIGDTVEIVDHLKPIYNFKAG